MAEIFHFEHALLPDGWAEHVTIEVEAGFIRRVAAGETAGGREAIALPGLASLHSHTFQRGMAGLAETRGPSGDNFWSWRQVMYRFLGALTPEDVEAIAAFAFMEMLENGFTSVGEFHYLHHDCDGKPYANLAELSERIAGAAGQTGIGLTLLPSYYAQSNFGAAPPNHGQRRFINSPDQFARLVEGGRAAIKSLPHANLGLAPHSLRAVTPQDLAAIIALAPEGPIHIHAAEQTREVDDCLDWSGQRPVEWLLNHAPVGKNWCLIHATHMNADEVRRLAASGAVAGLCPLTEASLGDGIFEAVDFMTHGGMFGIGTDSNIEIHAAGELKQLEYSQRLKHRARNVLAPYEGASTGAALYYAAALGGARALQRRQGELRVGQAADFVVLDKAHVTLAGLPPDRWLDAYIFTANRGMISQVIVGGKAVVAGGTHVAHEDIARAYAKVLKRIAAF